MSLNDCEHNDTINELQENFRLSGLSVAALADAAGLTESDTRAALSIEPGTDPVTVWLLRDKLETAVRNNGREPVPYSKLTEENRKKAYHWFGVTDQR
ncbi:DUF2316 family protein [Corynebacterium massiliense]|uniref:DUF2316 family protein n=1 Tax=Corynebacterium massiliense TaxID=441501 RepID=UPI0023547C57|nr:DUF2316 family protein [Corynebacterium massiliense]